MPPLIHRLERAAARGAEGLAPEGRAVMAGALCALQREGGGFSGLDGRADPYYSFFAWLCLRALGAPFDRSNLCRYMASRDSSRQIDRRCADLLLVREGRRSRISGWASVAQSAARGELSDAYGAFTAGLLLDALLPRGAPRWAASALRRRLVARDASRLPTPQLAARVALAAIAGADDAESCRVLAARRHPSGGYASADGARPDLLATAAALFATALHHTRDDDGAWRRDLDFTDACWQEDGLFGASPLADRGDAEHTFYGLLVLGVCRSYALGAEP